MAMSQVNQSNVRFPNESASYRRQRAELLAAEAQLRQQTEQVAEMRRGLPLGGLVPDYEFDNAQGSTTLGEQFLHHNTLIAYSFMYGPDDSAPCPMCSSFVDGLLSQLPQLQQCVDVAVIARSPYQRIQHMVTERGWQGLNWLSAAHNRFSSAYHSEDDHGGQRPMCHVFVKQDGRVHHQWSSELLFVPRQGQPRHLDILWPLWNLLDLTPAGRRDFMPS